MSEYVLGTGDAELERLRFQQEVWGEVSAAALERAGLARGQRVLDAGAGPGFVTAHLRDRVGPDGHVTALDESPRWQRHLRAQGWDNVTCLEARLEEAVLEPAAYDLVFSRWVLGFLADVPAALARLLDALVPGGRLVVQDYNHEGVSIFPRSPGFEAMVRATRALYARSGGDTFLAGSLPRLLSAAGFELVEVRPNVLCGGPDSPAFRWADAFFPAFAATFLEQGLVSEEEAARFEREWAACKADPHAMFFSPIVADVIARRPG